MLAVIGGAVDDILLAFEEFLQQQLIVGNSEHIFGAQESIASLDHVFFGSALGDPLGSRGIDRF